MSTLTTTRRKRFQRPPEESLPPFRYQVPRDDKILTAVYRYGKIPSNWLAELAPGSNQVNSRRLQKLFKKGYLKRIKQGNNAPMAYELNRQGAKRLAELWNMTATQVLTKSRARFKSQIYDHAREVCEFRYAADRAVADRPDVRIKFWYADGSIIEPVKYLSYRGPTKKTIIKDSFIGLEFSVPGRDPVLVGCALERDRSMMSGTTLRAGRLFDRYDAYWHLWKQGVFYRNYGVKALVVLTVCKSPERAENMRAMARDAGNQHNGSRLFWFTHAAAFQDNPSALFNPIWKTPRDETLHALDEFIPPALYPDPIPSNFQLEFDFPVPLEPTTA